MIAAAQIDLTAQPARMKQGGDKLSIGGDATLPVFADSLVVATKAAGEPVAAVGDSVKGGRRLKSGEDDSKPSGAVRESDAAAVLMVIPPLPVPQEMLAGRMVADENAMAVRGDSTGVAGAAQELDAAATSAAMGRLQIALPDSGATTDRVAVPVVAVSPGVSEAEPAALAGPGVVAHGDPDAPVGAGSRVPRDVKEIGNIQTRVANRSVPVAAGAGDGGPKVAPRHPAEAHQALDPQTATSPAPIDAAGQANVLPLRDVPAGTNLSGAIDHGRPASETATATAAADPNLSTAGLPVPAVTVDPRTALMKAGSGSVGRIQTAGPGGLGKTVANIAGRAKAASKNGSKDGLEMKQPDKPTPSTADAADAGAGAGDGMQRDGSPQPQASAQAAAAVSHHPAAEIHISATDTGMATPIVTASGEGGRSTRMTEGAAPVAVEVAQPAVAINTAKLLQSVGQTEMHVGMRSTEFGNISIRTSATPELMSAQISVDHGDLARMLATHIPEMQARLGGSQPVHVQIDMNGQSTGANGGQANGSAQNAQGSGHGRGQEHSEQGSRASNGGGSVRRYERESLPAGLMNDSSGVRLDVRA